MRPPPVIKAKFELDEEGHPRFVSRGDVKHFRINLHVENVPDDTYAVTYLLDDTYYDPARESRDQSGGFSEVVTSFGDFTVQAKVRSRGGVTTVATPLSAALEAGHGERLLPEIEEAVKAIRAK
jgi:hypothetical protein